VPTVGKHANKTLDVCSLVLLVLSVFGASLCFLPIIFSIRSFASRHTRGQRFGELISLKKFRKNIKHIFFILIGKTICPVDSPIEDAELARKEHGKPQQRLAHLAYFQRNYGTYNPELIRNQRMLDMRALNYEKIYPEVCARRTLIVSLCLAFVCFVLVLIMALFMPSTSETCGTESASETTQIQNGNEPNVFKSQ
jgi:hypothetical protein